VAYGSFDDRRYNGDSVEEIENDILTGQISREMANQEYYCSFEIFAWL